MTFSATAVQLMRLDREGKLKAIEETMAPCCEKALEYFDRANDHLFFPGEEANLPWAKLDLTEPANWSRVNFSIKVHAYSGIGDGATFDVDFGSQTFQPMDNEEEDIEEDDDSMDSHSICEDHHGSDSVDDDDEFARKWECV